MPPGSVSILRFPPRPVLRAAVAACLVAAAPLQAQRWTVRMVKVAQIGVEEGDRDHVLGLVQDVALDRAGRIYILDAMARNVRVFTRDGRFVATLGRMGRGPGEFFIPVALAVDRDDRLYVLDQGNARVDVFAPAPGGRRAYAASFPVAAQPYDLCIAGERLYVLGADRGGAVTSYSLRGRRIGVFGAAPGGADPLLSATLNGGSLECQGAGVLFLPHLNGEVRRYSAADGRLAWSLPIPGYNSVRLVRNADGSVTLRPGRNRTHEVASAAVDMGGGYALVQVGTLHPRATSGTEFREVRSFVTTPRSRLLSLPGPMPRVVAARDGYAAAVRTDPFPSVIIYTLRTWEEAARP